VDSGQGGFLPAVLLSGGKIPCGRL
jgi:hypothetical protein